MISTNAFVNRCEYLRIRKQVSTRKFCEDLRIGEKEYGYYLKGIKTPPPGFVLEVMKYYGAKEFI